MYYFFKARLLLKCHYRGRVGWGGVCLAPFTVHQSSSKFIAWPPFHQLSKLLPITISQNTPPNLNTWGDTCEQTLVGMFSTTTKIGGIMWVVERTELPFEQILSILTKCSELFTTHTLLSCVSEIISWLSLSTILPWKKPTYSTLKSKIVSTKTTLCFFSFEQKYLRQWVRILIIQRFKQK